MRATRAPANPSAENSARAAARIRSRVPWGSRAWLGRERFTRVTDGMTEFDVIVTVWVLPGQAGPRGRAGETGGPAGRLGEAAAQGERPEADQRGQHQRERGRLRHGRAPAYADVVEGQPPRRGGGEDAGEGHELEVFPARRHRELDESGRAGEVVEGAQPGPARLQPEHRHQRGIRRAGAGGEEPGG